MRRYIRCVHCSFRQGLGMAFCGLWKQNIYLVVIAVVDKSKFNTLFDCSRVIVLYKNVNST